MKKFYAIPALALSLCAAASVSGVSLRGLNLSNLKTAVSKVTRSENPAEYTGRPTVEQLKAYAAAQTRAEQSADETLPLGVEVERVLYKSFEDWTAGSPEAPDMTDVATDEALFDKLFGADSDWTVWEAYQAGGNMFLGMDEVGDHGPGYFMTPGFDFTDPKVAYRFRVTAMNVNPNAQEQVLQAFFMSQEPGKNEGQMVGASGVAMKYKEWSVCEWIGKVPAGNPYVRAMALGWQGKVLIKEMSLDKIIYPVASVSDISLKYDEGKLTVEWQPAEDAAYYKITLHEATADETMEVGTQTVESTTAIWEMSIDEAAERYYATVVACNKEGQESYPVSGYAELAPEKVGDAVALAATNVTADGFTANWETIAGAGRTLVYPVQNHKAASDQEYVLLNETFSNVPAGNDIYNPAQIIPMMGMGNIDLMMSRAGWTTDVCFFFRLTPEMPALAMSNMFTAYGMPGYLLSPKYDLSVGEGKVYISGMAMSGADDAVVTFFLVDADTMTPYASKEVEVNTSGALFDITLEGGRKDSRIMFYMTDCADEEMIVVPALSISVDMNEGNEITAPLPTEFVKAPATSYDFSYPVDADNSYSYTVQGIFNDLSGNVSEPIEVKAAGSGVATAVAGRGYAIMKSGVLSVSNPDGKKVSVVTADGKVLAVSSDIELNVNVGSAAVIVRIGDKAFKFVR